MQNDVYLKFRMMESEMLSILPDNDQLFLEEGIELILNC